MSEPTDHDAALRARARDVTATVAATIQMVAEYGLTEAELYELAQRIGPLWDDACCPLCEEVLCDDPCPLAGIRAAQRHADLTVRPDDRSTMDTDQTGEPQRVHVRVLLTVGNRADVVTPQHPASAPLGIPAAVIARDAGLLENELPGREFTAIQDGDELRDFRLVDDPRV